MYILPLYKGEDVTHVDIMTKILPRHELLPEKVLKQRNLLRQHV